MSISESNIILDFPDHNYFRFQDCAAYKKLSAFNFKEVDACWADDANKLFYLIELKDYTLANTADKESASQRIWDIVKKAVDSLQMVNAIRLNTDYSNGFNVCMPLLPSTAFQLHFITIIHIDEAKRADLQFFRDEFKNRFKAYAELFDINYYTLITYQQAKKHFAWVK